MAAVGGTVEVDGAVLEIPPGALEEDTMVTVDVLPAAGLPGSLQSPVFDFGPDGLQFQASARLTLTVSDTSAGASVAWFDAAAASWVGVPTTVDETGLVGTIDHFTYFAAVEPDTEDTGTTLTAPPEARFVHLGLTGWCYLAEDYSPVCDDGAGEIPATFGFKSIYRMSAGACALYDAGEIACWNHGEEWTGLYGWIEPDADTSVDVVAGGGPFDEGVMYPTYNGQKALIPGDYTSAAFGHASKILGIRGDGTVDLEMDGWASWDDDFYEGSPASAGRIEVTTVGDGGYHDVGCSLSSSIRCWGGPYATGTAGTPPNGGGYLDLAIGDNGGCAITADFQATCWRHRASDPPFPTPPEGPWSQLSVRAMGTAGPYPDIEACGIREGLLVCW